ncbi:hypothetical protein [Pseudoalteromonas distincta]|uniref:hypothetical protein n=1 Tax=Pseudoalteromonas distincta TaxID=77608 RepID=UPI0032E3279D
MSTVECRYGNVILKERKLFFIFTVLSILMPMISLTGLLKPSCEALGFWFQRSGATTVVFAIFAELKAANMLSVFKPAGMVNRSFHSTRDKYIKQIKIYNYIALFLIVLGTVIWGYGDLILKMA